MNKPMNDKETIGILVELLEKKVLNEKEETAVRNAIGILSWTKLSEGRLKQLKSKREHRVE